MKVRLSEARVGSVYLIIEIKGDIKVRQHLSKLGVLPGVKVKLENKAALGGALLLNVEGKKVGVERRIADKILVGTHE